MLQGEEVLSSSDNTRNFGGMHPRVIGGLQQLGFSISDYQKASISERLKTLELLGRLEGWGSLPERNHHQLHDSRHSDMITSDDIPSQVLMSEDVLQKPASADVAADGSNMASYYRSDDVVRALIPSLGRGRGAKRGRGAATTAASSRNLTFTGFECGKSESNYVPIDLNGLDEDIVLGTTKGSIVARQLCERLRESVASGIFIGVYWDSKGFSYRARIRGQFNASGGRFKPAKWTLRGVKKCLNDAIRSRNGLARRFGLPEIDIPSSIRHIDDGSVGSLMLIAEEHARSRGRGRRPGRGRPPRIPLPLPLPSEFPTEGDSSDNSLRTPKKMVRRGSRNEAPSRMSTEEMASVCSTNYKGRAPPSHAVTKKASSLLLHMKSIHNEGNISPNGEFGIYWCRGLARYAVQFTISKRTYYGKGIVPLAYSWDGMRLALLTAIEERNALAEKLAVPDRVDPRSLDSFVQAANICFDAAEGSNSNSEEVNDESTTEANSEIVGPADPYHPIHIFAQRLLRAARAVSPLADRLSFRVEWDVRKFKYRGLVKGDDDGDENWSCQSSFVPQSTSEDGIKLACCRALQSAGECEEVLTLIRTFKTKEKLGNQTENDKHRNQTVKVEDMLSSSPSSSSSSSLSAARTKLIVDGNSRGMFPHPVLTQDSSSTTTNNTAEVSSPLIRPAAAVANKEGGAALQKIDLKDSPISATEEKPSLE